MFIHTMATARIIKTLEKKIQIQPHSKHFNTLINRKAVIIRNSKWRPLGASYENSDIVWLCHLIEKNKLKIFCRSHFLYIFNRKAVIIRNSKWRPLGASYGNSDIVWLCHLVEKNKLKILCRSHFLYIFNRNAIRAQKPFGTLFT